MESNTISDTTAFEVFKNRVPEPEDRVLQHLDYATCPIYIRREPPCRASCPSSNDIRGYLTSISQAEMYKEKLTYDEALDKAWYTYTDKNPFPAIHGRVCPHPCEDGCNRGHKDEAVGINSVERAIGDHGLKRGLKLKMLADVKQDKKVAVIGAGPSGLSCAYQMARRGYPVTVFEAAEKPGGLLRYGIPSYRLSDEVLDAEIQNVLDLGVELRCGTRVGRDISWDEVRNSYDAVYVAVGAGQGVKLGLEGDDQEGVLSGVDFLARINSGENIDVGQRVIVVGGGNTAMDAARVSRRLGADVTLLYRRTQAEMPAIKSEITAAEEEGIEMELLANPLRIERAADGSLTVTCIRMELGEPDSSGRRRPVPVEGSEFTITADSVIAAIGQHPDLTQMEEIGENGWIKVNATKETAMKGVFAGGDAVSMDLVTTAVGHGRQAAQAMEAYLNQEEFRKPYVAKPVSYREMRLDYYKPLPRNNQEDVSPEARVKGFLEVNKPLTAEEVMEEAKRCMSCGLCFGCDQCRVFCHSEAISKDLKRVQGSIMFTDYAKCCGCAICHVACPCHYIEMGMGG